MVERCQVDLAGQGQHGRARPQAQLGLDLVDLVGVQLDRAIQNVLSEPMVVPEVIEPVLNEAMIRCLWHVSGVYNPADGTSYELPVEACRATDRSSLGDQSRHARPETPRPRDAPGSATARRGSPVFGETLRETLRPFDLPDGVAAMLKREADCDISLLWDCLGAPDVSMEGAGRVVQDVHYYNENNSIPPPPTHPTQQKNQTIPFC